MLLPDDGRATTVVLVDPCGQGQMALANQRRAVAAIKASAGAEISQLFAQVHTILTGSAGVSLAVVRIDADRANLEFAGIGRGYGAVVSSSGIALLNSNHGKIGVGLARSPVLINRSWQPGSLLVLAADGLVDAWDLTSLRHLQGEPLEVIGRRLGGYPDRMPEDASLVLVRERL